MKKRSLTFFIIITWILFIGSIICGYSIPNTQKDLSSSILTMQPGGQVFLRVILANLQAGGIMCVTNIITLGVFGSLSMIINGIIVGQIIHLQLPHLGIRTILLALIPHGLFEISSFGLFLSLGTWWSYQSVLHWFFHRPWPSKMRMRRSLDQLILAIGLMVVAALIESFITPFLINHF